MARTKKKKPSFRKFDSTSSGVNQQRKSEKVGKQGGGIGPLKQRIRDIERLFRQRDDLPANVRVELEREMDAHKHEVAVKEAESRQKEMVKRYHMVRFFGQKYAHPFQQRSRHA